MLLVELLLLVVVGKFVVWAAVVKLFGYSWQTSTLVGTGLTQIGEFSFILVQVAHSYQLVGDEFYHATLAVSLLSILVNACAGAGSSPVDGARPVIGADTPRLAALERHSRAFYN